MKFKSVRNGQVAELVSENDKQVIIKLESGEEKTLSHATLKRWWKPMEEESVEEQSESGVVEEITQEEATEAVEEPAEEIEEVVEEEQPIQEESAPEEPKQEAKKPREKISGDHPLKEFIEGLATERNTKVFQATVPSFRSLKVDGKMYMAFTFNKKGVTLWMRSKAVEELTDYKKMNHMFDARVHFGEDNKSNKEKITKLLDASLEFQKNK